ncbi:MAG: cytochrome c oxidase subunit II [Leptolyngbyaceae cyanobacterium CSU_1_3]|nr:cytochrome c oxidase subunit II [Leptolyngbyaceae cyanobacterium CSU_1_3]
MKIPSSILTLVAGILLTGVSFWVGQHHGLLPIAASKEAFLVDGLFNTMMTISVGLFIIVQGAIVFAAIRFRHRLGDDTDALPIHGNIPLEIFWTAIPAIVVLGLAVYSFDVYTQIGGRDPMDHSAQAQSSSAIAQVPGSAMAAPLPSNNIESNNVVGEAAPSESGTVAIANQNSPSSALAVNVAAMQFAWIFNYPDSGVMAGELHVPLGREVRVNLSANDVIHAFWVPEFRLKQDAVPGRESVLSFTPTSLGTYPLICAELCGAYHGAMKSQVIVETPAEFDSWLQTQIASGTIDSETAIAQNPASMTSTEFLAPYAKEIGITPQALEQLHHTDDVNQHLA